MSGLEFNKILASLLIAALIAMIVGNFVNILYKPELDPEKRGFQIAVEENEEDIKISTAKPEEDPFEDIKSLMKQANVSNGEKLFVRCQSCHTINKGGPNRVGPNLYGIVGEKIGEIEGYTFSTALVSKEGNWDFEQLSRFIHNPRAYAPGTKMSFAGLRNPKDVVDLVSYLNQQSDNPINID